MTFYEIVNNSKDKQPKLPNGEEKYVSAVKSFAKTAEITALTEDLTREQIKDFLAAPRVFVDKLRDMRKGNVAVQAQENPISKTAGIRADKPIKDKTGPKF